MSDELIAKNVMNAVETATFEAYKDETSVVPRALEIDSIECALEDNAQTIRSLINELVELSTDISIVCASERQGALDRTNSMIRTLGESRGYLIALKNAHSKKGF